MDLSLTEEQIMIQDMAKKFAESELAPVAAQLDETMDQKLFLANLAQLTELGFMGLNIKAEYGGVEAGSVAFSLAITELARACASTAVTTSVTNMVAEVIQAVGNEEQKQKHLPKLCSGEYRAGGFCLTEATAGSDPAGMKTQAVKDGDDYLISGSKLYITSASFADVFVVWAKLDGVIRGFILDKGMEGLSAPKIEGKFSLRASITGEIVTDNVFVPSENMLPNAKGLSGPSG